MRVSPKKLAANRRNALKSTGPKTDVGRRSSSLNSTRHGLSVPLPLELLDPLQKALSQLIEQDEIPPDDARDLAQKIIDYERNMLYLFESFNVGDGAKNNSNRYYKRSSNQLIKALRRL